MICPRPHDLGADRWRVRGALPRGLQRVKMERPQTLPFYSNMVPFPHLSLPRLSSCLIPAVPLTLVPGVRVGLQTKFHQVGRGGSAPTRDLCQGMNGGCVRQRQGYPTREEIRT